MMSTGQRTLAGSSGDGCFDVIVVGAGPGGIYAVHRFAQLGLTVLGIEAGGGVGGVWYHNRYPGARVDVDSLEYSYQFSPAIARRWRWTERYAAQPELAAYFDLVADNLNVRRRFLFNTRVASAAWEPARRAWHISTDSRLSLSCRYLIMATGNLSAARRPDFAGLDRFRGQLVQSSHWPEEEVSLGAKRVGVIGTGSSGVQVATALASQVGQLYVFQRTANYSVPAQNRVLDGSIQKVRAERLAAERQVLLARPAGTSILRPEHPADYYSPAEQQALLERQWVHGGQGMNAVFSDQGVDPAVNQIVSEFARNKIRETVKDQDLAEALCPRYPIGTRRLILDTGYYEIFNQDNVTLVNLASDPLLDVTASGLRTRSRLYELDVIVCALGFKAFSGALNEAGIANQDGVTFAEAWSEGPRTLLGLMSRQFPNLFLPTGAGSPSVLVNMILLNEFHMDWIADCISYLEERGLSTIVPTEEGEELWTAEVAEISAQLLRRQVDNYMVHVNQDGSRVFMPYAGGLDRYVPKALQVAADGYTGFRLG
jgi:cation diffusion facilitator CzcD-associated flavoprotein CzcO